MCIFIFTIGIRAILLRGYPETTPSQRRAARRLGRQPRQSARRFQLR